MKHLIYFPSTRGNKKTSLRMFFKNTRLYSELLAVFFIRSYAGSESDARSAEASPSTTAGFSELPSASDLIL